MFRELRIGDIVTVEYSTKSSTKDYLITDIHIGSDKMENLPIRLYLESLDGSKQGWVYKKYRVHWEVCDVTELVEHKDLIEETQRLGSLTLHKEKTRDKLITTIIDGV